MDFKDIQIVADDREVSSGIVDVFKERLGISVTVERLPVGDYEVDSRLLFERKTLVDFVASIKDGRLFRQAHRLACAALKTAVILEGTSSDLASSRMHREAIQGAIVSLSIQFGLPILRSRDPKESAGLMIYAAKQERASKDYVSLRHGKRPKTRRRRQLYVLQGLPYVGPKKARLLLNHFGSVRAVMSASPEELTSIPGMGDYTAKAVYNIVKENSSLYSFM